jgi:hypothetical protein
MSATKATAFFPSRLTIVVSHSVGEEAWVGSVKHVDSVPAMLRIAAAEDVERVILDRSATTDEFLHLLSALPSHIAGDVLLVRDDGRGFLSAVGRGGDRVLYALSPGDVAFYFRTNALTTGRFALTA